MGGRVRSRLIPGALGGLLVLGAIGGMWGSARLIEQRERDRADAALAASAVAFLTVVVPAGPANGYDPARLLATANTLERATFWPGGLALSLGAVPLLPDTIGLAPVPDSLLGLLAQGAGSVVARHARYRASLVPLLDRDRTGMIGWAAAWGTVPSSIPSSHTIGFSVLAVLLLLALLVPTRGPMARRIPLATAGVAALALLGLDLRLGVGATTARAAAVRVGTLKRLIEMAATAPGVRQATLPEIAIGVRVEPRGTPDSASAATTWTEDSSGAVVAMAATPRTGGALELTLVPPDDGIRRLDLLLALAGGAGLLGLLLLAATVRYSSGTGGTTHPDSA